MSRIGRAQLVATVVGLLLASAMVWRTSSAAFTGSTGNTGNSFAAGTVVLSDDDSGSALFTATAWVPTDSATACIEVSYDGSAAPGSAVTFGVTVSDTIVGGNGLDDDLDVVVELGNASTTCAAFAGTTLWSTTMDALPTAGSPGSTGWTPTLVTDTMRPFRITVTLGSDTANDAQGESLTADLTWAVSS